MSGQWHCHGTEEAGDWEKLAGNGIALKKEEKGNKQNETQKGE